MIREVTLEEISDGKLYDSNDMVKADCGDCEGCSACCKGMGASIILDPLDVHRMTIGLGITFEALLEKKLSLNVVDGIILPNLNLSEEDNACGFLDAHGRCSIHPYRPGICRLFPLGRFYEGDSFRYFLQVHECEKRNRTKVKVKKWIDTPDLKQYETFILEWHSLLKDLQKEETRAKEISMYVLKAFYLTPFSENIDFYRQVHERICQARDKMLDFSR